MSLALLLLIVIFNAQLQELLQVLDGVVVVVGRNLFLNKRNLLVALRLFVLVVCAFGHVQTLLKESQTQVELVLILVLDGNQLVDPHEVARNVASN